MYHLSQNLPQSSQISYQLSILNDMFGGFKNISICLDLDEKIDTVSILNIKP